MRDLLLGVFILNTTIEVWYEVVKKTLMLGKKTFTFKT